MALTLVWFGFAFGMAGGLARPRPPGSGGWPQRGTISRRLFVSGVATASFIVARLEASSIAWQALGKLFGSAIGVGLVIDAVLSRLFRRSP
jgi:hypothetical protein